MTVNDFKKQSLRGAKRTWQSNEIASLCPVHHAVQGFVRNDDLGQVNKKVRFKTTL
jgi:hypothetical protein